MSCPRRIKIKLHSKEREKKRTEMSENELKKIINNNKRKRISNHESWANVEMTLLANLLHS